MANISHFTQTVNGASTTYDIHDADAVPRSGGAVISGTDFFKNTNNSYLMFCAGNEWNNGGGVALYGKDSSTFAGGVTLKANNGTNYTTLDINPNGATTLNNNGTIKNIALAEDVIPRSGGAVMTGNSLSRIDDTRELRIDGGIDWAHGGSVAVVGKNGRVNAGYVCFFPHDGTTYKGMYLQPDGTWTWDGTACQITSDQRLKQQITEIDDKLLDAWQDVDLVQFKYNDAVDQKGDKARLHTGFVVQQIDSACKKHGVDISQYGLYCHEVYPEEVEEIEVEQKDGTKTKEKKVIREASEHYSLRYTEALIVECKYLRRCVERLTARIEQLEKGNNIK